MSLLNDMLKNLEKQNLDQKQETTKNSILTQFQTPEAKERIRLLVAKILEIGLIIFLSVIAIYLSFYLIGKISKKNSSKILANFKTGNANARIFNDKAVLQNLYVTTATANKEIVIQFTFDLPIRYQLIENNTHSQATIILNNVITKTSLPLVPVGLIKGVNSKIVGNDLYIILDTEPGTELRVIQDQMQKPIRLIFILTGNALTVNNLSANNLPLVPGNSPTIVKNFVPPKPEEQAAIDYQDALNLIAHNHLDQAIPFLLKVLQAKPDSLEARKNLVILLLKKNQINEAMNYLEVGLRLNPDAIDLIVLKAKVALYHNNPNEALRILKTVTPSIIEDPRYYALLASIQQQLGQAAVAEQIYKQLLSLNSGNAQWWVGMGLALESQQKRNIALQAYRQAINLGGLSPNLQIDLQEKIAKLGK